MDETTPLGTGREGAGWHLSLRRHRLIPLAVAATGAASAVVACVQALHGNVPLAFITGLLAPALLSAPWLTSRRKVAPYLLDAGLLLPVNPRSWGFINGTVWMGAALVFAGAAIYRRAVEEGTPGAGLVALLPIAGLGAAVWWRTGQTLASRWRRDPGILVTADGLILRIDARPLVVPWGAVVEVRAHWIHLRDGFFAFDDEVRNFLTIRVHRRLVGRKVRPLDVDRLACDPELALGILRHYLGHPDARAELSTAAALDRIGLVDARK